ncbi:MAG: HAD family hydrolase [Eubacteriales bacterium]
MIDTVIFDFDGTIANTNNLIINSFRHIFDDYNKPWDESYIRSTFGEPLRKVISRDFSAYDVDEVLTKYRGYQVNRFNTEVFLYPTVTQTLACLYKKRIKMGIATSRTKDSTLKALDYFNVIHYFESVVAVEDVQNHKPHKEPLLKCIKELNSKSYTTLYVGDSKFDLECAKHAGVLPILVGWHSNAQALAAEYDVKYVLNKMEDLTDLLNIL